MVKFDLKSRLIMYALAGLLAVGLSYFLYPYAKGIYTKNTTPPPPEVQVMIPESPPEPEPADTPPVPEAKTPEKLVAAQGRLLIPKLGLNLSVYYGVGETELKKGPGFYPQSGFPSIGNVCIAGHRNAHGSPFLHLDDLVAGDDIYLIYQQVRYHYLVERVFVTAPTDWSVVDPTPRPALTLTTCTPAVRPPDGKYDRLIVRAYLRDSQSET
jgi:sortase A